MKKRIIDETLSKLGKVPTEHVRHEEERCEKSLPLRELQKNDFWR